MTHTTYTETVLRDFKEKFGDVVHLDSREGQIVFMRMRDNKTFFTIDCQDSLQGFITTALLGQKEKIKKKVKRLRHKHNGIRCPLCKALDEIISLIKKV